MLNHVTAAHLFGGAMIEAGVEVVVFLWSNDHGHCYECGLPAAFVIDGVSREVDGRPNETDLRCAVCAANAAADGVFIKRIDEEGAHA